MSAMERCLCFVEYFVRTSSGNLKNRFRHYENVSVIKSSCFVLFSPFRRWLHLFFQVVKVLFRKYFFV